jgi:hypothetical protein
MALFDNNQLLESTKFVTNLSPLVLVFPFLSFALRRCITRDPRIGGQGAFAGIQPDR